MFKKRNRTLFSLILQHFVSLAAFVAKEELVLGLSPIKGEGGRAQKFAQKKKVLVELATILTVANDLTDENEKYLVQEAKRVMRLCTDSPFAAEVCSRLIKKYASK